MAQPRFRTFNSHVFCLGSRIDIWSKHLLKHLFLNQSFGIVPLVVEVKRHVSRKIFLGLFSLEVSIENMSNLEENSWKGQFRHNSHMGEDHWSGKKAKEAVPLCGGEAQLGRVMVSGRRGQRPTTGLRQRALDPASERGLATFTEVVKETGG